MRGWRDSKRADKARAAQNRRSSGAKYFGLRLELLTMPQRIHLVRPEKAYVDPFSGLEFDWKKGIRYYLPPPANKYVDAVPGQDLIAAYTTPSDYGLNIAPLKKCQKLRPKGYNALSGNVEEYFHLVEFSREDGSTYRSREFCNGRNCKFCQDGWPKVFGKRMYVAFNNFQWKTVIEPIMEKLERYCRCGGYRYPTYYACGQCGELLIDVTTSCSNCGPDAPIHIDETTHTAFCEQCGSNPWSLLEAEDERLSEMANQIVRCPKCNYEDYPQIQLVCTDPNGKQCPGDPYDIFDIQMRMKKIKGETDKKYTISIEPDWEIKEHDPRLFDPNNQRTGEANEDPEIADRVAESFRKPLPLDDIFAPTAASEVAADLGIPNLFATAEPTYQGTAQMPADDGNPDEQQVSSTAVRRPVPYTRRAR